MKISEELKQHQPVANGSPTVYETAEVIDARFLKNCQEKFPGVKDQNDLILEALKILKAEISLTEYDGKTDDEIMSTLNGNDKNPSIVNRIWNQVPYVPNAVTVDDIEAARAV